LGIVILILILFRQMDRNNRSRNLLRDYTERQKKELGDFVKDQERAVKDYAISLNVERDAAKELMKRLQQTEDELSKKAQAMVKIDNQIKAYESSLAELEGMTSRVQENMNRVRDESAFVDATGKRIGEVKDKLAEFDKDLVNIGKKYERVLEDIENKFEKDNTASLEKAANTVMATVKSTVSDLRAAEETIERKVEEHRLAVAKVEEGRAASLARDTDYIDKLLAKAVEQAGKRADKMEEAALIKLKEQAEDRILKLKAAEEERLRSYQESAKARILEVQALVKSIRDEWRTERSDWETKDKAVRDERKKDLEVFAASFDASKKQIDDFSVKVNGIVSSQEAMLTKVAEETKLALVKNVREEWRTERSEWETKDKAIRDERKKDMEVFAAMFEASKKQIEDFSLRVNEIISSQEALLLKESEEMKQTLVSNIRKEWSDERSDWETKDKAIRDERKKDMEVFAAMFEASKKQIEDFSQRVNEIISSQETLLLKESEEMKQTLVKKIREEWSDERSGWETKDKAIRDERKKDLENFAAMFEASKKQIDDFSLHVNEIVSSQKVLFNEIVSSQEALLVKAAEEMKQKALEVNGAKLEEYRRAQDIEFRRLESLADDSRKLDAELRHYMQELIGRLKEEFSVYQREAEGLRKAETENFSLSAAHLKGEMTEIEKGLAALKAAASENITAGLKSFENEFFADLTKRNNEIDLHIVEWQNNFEGRLSKIGENSETALHKLEHDQAEEMKTNLSAMDARLMSELERLKSKTGAFEVGILDQMKAADDSVSSFREQLDRGLEDTRKEAEISIKAEIGNYSLTAAETVKKYQRELDDAWKGLSARLKELDGSVEEAHRRIRDLTAETDNRIASVRSSVEDAERHIREAKEQTKLIDVANAMKLEMERHIEDLRGDIDRLDQRRAEAAKLENEFIKIKRHEDDINAKMIKIFSEERRIENMEANFNRFLQISRSVEEKLADVTSSNDTLLGVQLQIRKLEEALGNTEEKYQRLERKNQVLDNTNDGIDRNFKSLQETEKLSDKIGGELVQYADELERIKTSIEKLSAESEKAAHAVDRIDVLNDALEEIEERIKSMQRARQWIADAETRLEELNRAAQAQARATDSLVKGKRSGTTADVGDGALSEQKRRDIIILKEQGWSNSEIAKAEKVSIGVVELVLETAPRDRD